MSGSNFPDETGENFDRLRKTVLKSFESALNDLKTLGIDWSELVADEENQDEFLSADPQYENLMYRTTTEKLNNLNITEAGAHAVCVKNDFSNQRQLVCVETEVIKNWERDYLQELHGVISVYRFHIRHEPDLYPRDQAEKLNLFLENLLNEQKNFQKEINSAGCLEDVAQTFVWFHLQLFDFYCSFLAIADQLPLELTLGITETVTDSISMMNVLLKGLNEYKATLEKIANIEPVEFIKRIQSLDGLIKQYETRIIQSGNTEDKPKITLNHQDVLSSEDYGNYLQTNIFKCKTPFHKSDVALHMFTKALVITEKKKNDTWQFLDHIYLNHALLLWDAGKKKCSVNIQDMEKSKIKHTQVIYNFKASSEDARQIWLDKFKTLLQ